MKVFHPGIITWDEALAHAEAVGRSQGEAASAQILTVQEMALRAARKLFAQLPQAFEEKIRATRDLEQLYQILERIVGARSLADVDLGE